MTLMVPVLNSVMDYITVTQHAVALWQLLAGLLGVLVILVWHRPH